MKQVRTNLSWLIGGDVNLRIRTLHSCAQEVYQLCLSVISASIDRENTKKNISASNMALLLSAAQCCQSLATLCQKGSADLVPYARACGELLDVAQAAVGRDGSSSAELGSCATAFRHCRDLCHSVASST